MPAEHIIKSYDDELRRLNNIIVEMGGLAESQLGAAIDAVAERDSELAARVVQDDAKVDALEQEADKIASDLERICDYAANVAKRSIALSQAPPIQPVYALPRMAHLAQRLVKEVL